MTSCGATSSQGSQVDLNHLALVGLLEALQLFVATGHGRVQGLLAALFAGPDLLQLLVDDGADLHEVAQADATRFVGGLADHLRDRHVGAGILLVEATLVGQLERRDGHRQVASALVALGCFVGLGEVGKELRHTLVFVGLLA